METLLIYGSLENPISKSTSKSYSKIIGFATKGTKYTTSQAITMKCSEIA
jgi:hypothetical protein